MNTATKACPKCDVEMNHQADKLVHPVSAAEAAQTVEGLQGLIEQVFACPNCGRIESQRLTAPSRS